ATPPSATPRPASGTRPWARRPPPRSPRGCATRPWGCRPSPPSRPRTATPPWGTRPSRSSPPGGGNIAIGDGAGAALLNGSNNIYIGNAGVATEDQRIRIGTAGTHAATYIAGIRGTTTAAADAVPVIISSQGQLGTVSSSIRFKHDIEDLAAMSERLYDLRPVSFR